MKDIVLLMRILGYAFILPVWLHTRKLPELCRKLSCAQTDPGIPVDKAIRYCSWLTWLKIPLSKNYCLWRSLVFYKFLKEGGVDVALNLGVRLDEKGRLRGHSWLTREGRTYLSDPQVVQCFKTIYVFPEPLKG